MERNLVVNYLEMYCPIVAADLEVVDPKVDAAAVVQAVGKRIVGVPVGRRGCTDCGPRDCRLMSPASSEVDV